MKLSGRRGSYYKLAKGNLSIAVKVCLVEQGYVFVYVEGVAEKVITALQKFFLGYVAVLIFINDIEHNLVLLLLLLRQHLGGNVGVRCLFQLRQSIELLEVFEGLVAELLYVDAFSAHVDEALEPFVVEAIFGGGPLIIVVRQHLLDQLLSIF